MSESFLPMLFKGKKVFVLVDAKGNPVIDQGRATMKYRVDDDRVYRPASSNLQFMEDNHGTKTVSPAARQKKKPVGQKSDPIPAGAVVAYTDGGCIGNPGPSGLGYLIRFPDNRVVGQGEPLGSGTNNIAELTAILRVLEKVTDPHLPLVIHTDSAYAIGVLTKGWKAKANSELIGTIRHHLGKRTNTHLAKVKGHAGNPDNEAVDQLANTAARTQKWVDFQ